MASTNYIDVFNEGRDTDAPLLTLYDDEGLRLFFDLLVASGQLYRQYFKAGNIVLVSFNVDQDLQTGTGYYRIQDGRVQILSETGALQGVLTRIKYDKVAGASSQTAEDDTARAHRYQEYLQQTLQQAQASGDQRQEAEVILQYHQAILEVAQAIEPAGEGRGKIDLAAFRAKVRGLEQQRAWFARNPDLIDEAAMKALIAAVTGTLQDIAQLSAEAQAQIQRAIVTRFYDIRHPPSNRQGREEKP